MPSALTWLDHDANAHDRSLRILALFQERESRDELGIGAVRDSISDRLFPGTSTIQTRLRYMLLIPWLYRQLEEKRVPASEFAAQARRAELELTTPLLDGGADGVFGRVSRGGLKRLPSSVYWAGLGAWEIRRFRGGQSDYHRCVDELYVRRGRAGRRENDEVIHDPTTVTWHPKLPPAPVGFPAAVDLQLTSDEAHFIVDRISSTHPDSLLCWLVLHGQPDDSAAPWVHHQHHEFPEGMRTLLWHAHRMADVVEGGARVYNLALARLRGDEALEQEHCAALDEWRTQLDLGALRQWSLDEFWREVVRPNHAVTPATRRFVEEWVDRMRALDGVIADDPVAHELVRRRECALKRGRSRFDNRGALNQWSGHSGTTRLAFRWPNTKWFLADLYPALGRS